MTTTTLQPDDDGPSKLERRLAQHRAEKTAQATFEAAANEAASIEYADLIPKEDTPTRPRSHEVTRLVDSMRANPILDFYTRFHRGKVGRSSPTSIQIQCPMPDHPDENPSANIDPTKNLWYCYACEVGGGIFDFAGALWGFPMTSGSRGSLRLDRDSVWPVITRYAKEVHGLDLAQRGDDGGLPTADTRQATRTPLPEQGTTEWQERLRIRARHHLFESDAKRLAEQMQAGGLFVPPSSSDSVATELLQPDPDIQWTVANVHSIGGNTTITASFKVGKTTFVLNLMKAMCDEELFLGEHEVRSIAGQIAYLNFEVEVTQMRRGFRDMNIRNLDKIWHLPLRGQGINLMDDAAYGWAVKEMRRREIEVLFLDPFSGAYYGDENDNSAINAFTKRLDEFKREAGIIDLFMPVHTGRFVEVGNERARGGAKLDDWTDHRWVLAKHSSGSRFFRAEGRRIDWAERELTYDRATNSLGYSAFRGTRATKAADATKAAVLDYIQRHPGCGTLEIRGATLGRTEHVALALKRLIDDFDVETRKGPSNKVCHYAYGTAPV